jgi:hypothetical protein
MTLAMAATTAAGVRAQGLPSEPFTLGEDRAVFGGDIALAIAPQDSGFFNYGDYQHSTLREARLGLIGSVRATDWISVLGELRTDNFSDLDAFALYARVRPWRTRRFDIQVGRIPPTFGAFTRRAYGHDNPLIGYPLAYQYLTSLRPDAVPSSADDLVRMRGRGWLSNFSIGSLIPTRGVPLATVFSWDTGVQVNTGWRMFEVAASVTNGTVSNPRVRDDNNGKQIATRVTVKPVPGLVIGTSFARGAFLSNALAGAIAPFDPNQFHQLALGLDVEYSRGHWLFRSDTVLSDWTLPLINAPPISNPLRALAVSGEGRYMFFPGFYAAARADHLGFSDVNTSQGPLSWDAAVTRIEVGGGFYLRRNVIARVSVQTNWRDGGRVQRETLPAVQLLYWF